MRGSCNLLRRLQLVQWMGGGCNFFRRMGEVASCLQENGRRLKLVEWDGKRLQHVEKVRKRLQPFRMEVAT